MKKGLLISIIVIIVLSLVTGFVSCAPKEEPTDGGDDGNDGDGGATTPDELKDVHHLDMATVTGGTFTQHGTSWDNNEVEFEHKVSDFSIAKYEVTYELWYAVYTWATDKGYTFANAGMEGHDGTTGATPTDEKYEPVTEINWRDAIVWCNAYSELMNYTPVYKFGDSVLKDSSDTNANNCDGATADLSANGYRLPTEGEWQFVASLKSDGNHHSWDWSSGATGDVSDTAICDVVAWYKENSEESTHAVGGKKPTDLGLYDMSGNVWEWCWDWYGDYPGDIQTDYTGLDENGSSRVNRGGSWYHGSDYLRVGYRSRYSPDTKNYFVGFRVARHP